MANNNTPFGLLWLSNLSAAPASILHIPKTTAFGVFIGDPVSRTAGTISAAPTPGTTPYLGVSLDYSPANYTFTNSVAVVISPDAIYAAQAFSATGFVAATIGLNANLHAGAGSALTKQSGWTIDDTTAAATATLDAHTLALYGTLVNAYGGYSVVELVFNEHRLNGGVAAA